MKDIRGAAKREDEYYRANPLQRCQVCGRLFVKRRDNVCSRNCLAKLEEQQGISTPGGLS